MFMHAFDSIGGYLKWQFHIDVLVVYILRLGHLTNVLSELVIRKMKGYFGFWQVWHPWNLLQYAKFVKPSFDDFVLPTKKYADVIIPRGGDNHVAIDLIVQHIRTKLGQHDLCKIYSNVYVIQTTYQAIILFDQTFHSCLRFHLPITTINMMSWLSRFEVCTR